jgi:uncharacterized protein
MALSTYIYLHGFASGPKSAKAQYLRDRFQDLRHSLWIPDLNQDDFSHLTLTRQLHQVETTLPSLPSPIGLIGSSFGGLTAAWLGDRHEQVQRLVLLAPAFGFLDHWLPKLGDAQLFQWQANGYLAVYHHAQGRSLPLHYDFVSDAQRYQDNALQRPIPTLILHGRNDEVIPIEASRAYAAHRPWVELVELDSDHALGDVQDSIWSATQKFLSL